MTDPALDDKIRFFADSYQLFPREILSCRPIVELDLGCGVGTFTAELARRYPERTVLAADVMLGRLRKLVKRALRLKLDNLEICRVEARYLLGLILPDGSLNRLHLLCPDPWPKDRHRSHRLLTSDFTAQLHRILKEDGIFHFSSDDQNYCSLVRGVIAESKLFAEYPQGIADLRDFTSDFELRWNSEGKTVQHLAFRRIPAPVQMVGH